MNISVTTDDCPIVQVLPFIGNTCLVFEGGYWYKAKMMEIRQDEETALVRIIESGKMVQSDEASPSRQGDDLTVSVMLFTWCVETGPDFKLLLDYF